MGSARDTSIKNRLLFLAAAQAAATFILLEALFPHHSHAAQSTLAGLPVNMLNGTNTIILPGTQQPITGVASPLASYSPTAAQIISGTINAPCANGPTTLAGLQSCSSVIPAMVSSIQAMMQQYSKCYYKGIELDVTQAKTASSCAGYSFGTPCSLVKNDLNGYMSETTTNNAGTSCGAPMAVSSVSIAQCIQPSQSEQSLLTTLGKSTADIDGMTASQADALLKQVTAMPGTSSTLQDASHDANNICFTLDASGSDANNGPGSMERNYMRGAFIQALAYYADMEESQLTCSHSITITNAPSCQAFAQEVANISASTENTITALQKILGGQKNIADIDACNTTSFNLTPANGNFDPGQLRQSAQHLCSARNGLVSAYTQLAMCNIFSQAQISYYNNVGAGGTQLANVLQPMNQSLENGICKQECSGSGSLNELKTCSNKCYQQQMPGYLSNKFSAIWPLPVASPSPGTCVGGTTSAQ